MKAHSLSEEKHRMKNRITSVQHGSAKCSDSPTCWFRKNSCKWGLNGVFREDWAAAKWNGTGEEQSCASLHYCSTKEMGADGWAGPPSTEQREPLKGFQQESSQGDRSSVITWWPREGAFSRGRHYNRRNFLQQGGKRCRPDLQLQKQEEMDRMILRHIL